MASVSEIKAQIEKKQEYLSQVPIVKKEIKILEAQLKTAEAEELADFLKENKIDVDTLKKGILDGSITLCDSDVIL